MARDKGRLDLKADIRRACAAADGFSVENLEPHDYQDHVERVLAAVLPHFELAYQRGVMAERSRAGYRALRARSKEQST